MASPKRKTFSVEERMSGDWIERWTGFTAFAAAIAFARKMDNQCHGKLRVVLVVRQPIKWKI